MDRRRKSGCDSVYDEYEDRGCGSYGSADSEAGGGRMSDYPLCGSDYGGC